MAAATAGALVATASPPLTTSARPSRGRSRGALLAVGTADRSNEMSVSGRTVSQSSSAAVASAPISSAAVASASISSAAVANTPIVNVLQYTTGAITANGSEVVFGVPIDDSGIRKVMKRVIVLAAFAATFYICHFVSNLLRGSYAMNTEGSSSLWTAISSLLIELSVPACGYYGALHGNRQLTCCFCSCNLFVTFVSVVAFIRLNIRIGELDGQCEQETNASTRKTCEVWTSDGADKYVMIVSMMTVICLGCLAFWFGNSLYQRLAQDFNISGPPLLPLVGEVITLSSFAIGSPGPEVLLTGTPLPNEQREQMSSTAASPQASESAGIGTAAGIPNTTATGSALVEVDVVALIEREQQL